jgi:hypothetical protein
MGRNIISIVILSFFAITCTFDDYDEEYSGCIAGETITFDGESLNSLYKNDFFELKLYNITPSGDIIFYIEGYDYLIEGNCVRRLKYSSIPNFSDHQVIYNSEGKFKWNPEPNRNPELTIFYQIYADYKFNIEEDIEIKPVNFISNQLYEKLSTKKPIVIVAIGTSITCGTHTWQWYYDQSDHQTYPYLVAKALNKIYGIECQVINRSLDGGGVNQIQDLNEVLFINPDVVFIELGMNDHNGETPNIEYFYSSINAAVNFLKINNIDVIIIGFFQQIESWELEYRKNTIAFNEVLSEIAFLKNVYFADIYSFFELIDKNKLYRDYTGDFMHHPTSFAHQLYYLNIMPFFIDDEYKESELLAGIY